LDKVRGEKVSEHDKIVECSQNDKGIPRSSIGGVLHRRDVWQGRQLDGKMVEADDWLGEYGRFHEEVERSIRTRNGLPKRKWEWKPRNSYPKWVREQARLRKKHPMRADEKREIPDTPVLDAYWQGERAKKRVAKRRRKVVGVLRKGVDKKVLRSVQFWKAKK